ncbi:P-loop ATPase, Sll1717 family [Nonlabens agnitus]|uniref:Uncharacterized protein n=1 Tax=Nonlabens agnitus TaxID=870484 RepID=A0A2S9WWM2_9FLAO|nr:hypothetical protein [Nonlabens agnitus]PRP67879.1 hypothetical protein BST86_12610 [Nonlabens agnitus]
MTFKEYITGLGFQENPFQHTNADKEKDYLSKYFIQPDYFEDVWGDIDSPVSNIIYAPRGGGKTAQRLMIEERALQHDNVLTITYTNHDLTSFKTASDVTLLYHLEYLNRLMLLAFFDRLNSLDDFRYMFEFSNSERQYIYKLCRIYLYETPASFPKQAINSLKTISDRAVDVWNKFKTPISEIIKKITKAKGLEVDISKIDLDKKLKMSHKDNFDNIRQLLNRLGLTTIYVLIDKVDEQSLTGNDPKASYDLIADLIKDLELLETPGMAFKFFLWDKLEPFCARFARPDRVFSYKLEWKSADLQEMLNERLSAYSDGNVGNAKALFHELKSLGRVILFSELSPRDCIRICNRILSEQFKLDKESRKLFAWSTNVAIDLFSKEKVQELIDNRGNLSHLSKVNSASFTIEELVSSKVAADSAAIRNIIRPWQTAGWLQKIGLVNRRNKRAVNEYAFIDIRFARYACNSISLDDFISKYVKKCTTENCKKISYRAFDKREYVCVNCGTSL